MEGYNAPYNWFAHSTRQPPVEPFSDPRWGGQPDELSQYTNLQPDTQTPFLSIQPRVETNANLMAYGSSLSPNAPSFSERRHSVFEAGLASISMHSSSSISSNSQSSSEYPLCSFPPSSHSSTSELVTTDLTESIATLRAYSPPPPHPYTAMTSNVEMFPFEEMMPQASSAIQWRLTNVPEESRTEPHIRPRLSFVEVSQYDMKDSLSVPVYPVDVTDIHGWKYIRCRQPNTKRVQFEPEAKSILNLTATILGADNLSCPIFSCQPCQEREERNRSKKKLSKSMNQAARNLGTPQESSPHHASTSMPIRRQNYMVPPLEFAGDELLPIQDNRVDLSFRITCYCRHHEESSGFCVRFTLADYRGQIVGEVMTDPIMIIDNHKVKPKLPRPRPPRRQRKVNGPVSIQPIHEPL